jgi:hypothetical protein
LTGGDLGPELRRLDPAHFLDVLKTYFGPVLKTLGWKIVPRWDPPQPSRQIFENVVQFRVRGGSLSTLISALRDPPENPKTRIAPIA